MDPGARRGRSAVTVRAGILRSGQPLFDQPFDVTRIEQFKSRLSASPEGAGAGSGDRAIPEPSDRGGAPGFGCGAASVGVAGDGGLDVGWGEGGLAGLVGGVGGDGDGLAAGEVACADGDGGGAISGGGGGGAG